jgi:hypothetical protein
MSVAGMPTGSGQMRGTSGFGSALFAESAAYFGTAWHKHPVCADASGVRMRLCTTGTPIAESLDSMSKPRLRSCDSKSASAMATVPWQRSVGLESTIQRIVQCWLASPLLIGAGGCMQARDPEPMSPVLAGSPASAQTPFAPAHCGERGWDPMPYVRASRTFDYQLLVYGNSNALGRSQHGTPCSTATDPSACQALVNDVPTPADCTVASPCSLFSITTTLGDDVQHRMSRDELLEFLGPIDSPEDALLIVAFYGYKPGPCGTDMIREANGAYEIRVTFDAVSCAGPLIGQRLLRVTRTGELSILSTDMPTASACPGRRPEGLREHAVASNSVLGAFFAHSAQLEAAAVAAFTRMIEELLACSAPAQLIAQARAARVDEQRHARQMRALARRHGACVPPIEVSAWSPRSLAAMALENAVEGCVRETWAAVVATHQAEHIADSAAAETLRAIAADERQHAALSWRLGAWLDAQLSPRERAQTAAAYRCAIAELREQTRLPVAEVLVARAGLPDQSASALLFERLCADLLWA